VAKTQRNRVQHDGDSVTRVLAVTIWKHKANHMLNLRTYLYIYLSIDPSIDWSMHLFTMICLSIYPSRNLSVCLCTYVSMYLCMYLSMYMYLDRFPLLWVVRDKSQYYEMLHFHTASNMHSNDTHTFSNNCTLACIQEVGSTVSCLFIIISRMYSRFELPLLDRNTSRLILSKKIFPKMLFTSVAWIFERWSLWIVLHVAICRRSSKNQKSFAEEFLQNMELCLKKALVVLHKQ